VAYSVLDDLVGPAPTAEARMMFGHRCFAVAGKVFACEVDGTIALRLPRDLIDRLDDPAIGPFRPGGQEMRGWIAIEGATRADFERFDDLIDRSLVYVSEIAAGVVEE
jgi:TfoX/Sxy family transcriptional regulator of competence genes